MNFRRIIRRASAVLLVLVVVVAVASVAEACPGCKQALAEGDSGQNVAKGYFWSILFMMAMPFTIVGTFGTCAYFQVRRARSQTESLANAEDENNRPAPTQ